MNSDLTQGPVMRSMLLFAVPMILGNLLQQCYNIADTMIVGQCLGKHALAAVGSSFTLMTFLTSILLGLCMGSGALFSIRFGQRDEAGLRESVCASFFLIAAAALLLNGLAFSSLDSLRVFLQVPAEVPAIGVVGIWWSVPIGWFLADLTGLLYYLLQRKRLLFREEQTH